MGTYQDDDNKCCHVFLPCCVFWAILFAGAIMFGVSFATVGIGSIAMLQDKYSKDIVKNTLYYSGRYHVGLVSSFLETDMQWKTVEFGSGSDADLAQISSTTADAASISLACSKYSNNIFSNKKRYFIQNKV